MPNGATEAKIFACEQSRELAEKIAVTFGAPLGNVITSTYSDGEFQPSYEESIRGTRIFIRQDILQQYYHTLVGQDKIAKTNQEFQLRLN